MNRTSLIPLIAVLAVPGMAAAQNFAGNYRLQDPQGTTTMIIQQDAGGRVSGTLTMDDGSVVNLNGEIKGTEALGIATLGGKNTLFKLNFQGEQLIYTMIAVTTDNKPDLANAQQFPFERAGGGLAGTVPSTGGGRNPLTGGAASDPFTGVFSDGKMHLELEGNGGRYQGQIQFQGASFPASAQSPDGRSLKGKFTSGADSFEFTGSLQGATLTFLTGGTTYQLRRQGGAPAAAPNPLGGGARKSVSAASQAPAAQPIAGGQVVNDPSMGVRFSVPPGWKHQKQQATYIMGHDTIPGMVIITPHTFNSAQEVIASASEPLYQGQDGQLAVTSQAVTLATNILAADYGGHMLGKQARGRVVAVLSPHGGGLMIMAGTEASTYGPQYAQLAEGIASSMQFSKPVMSAEAQNWSQRLRGRKLHYLKSNRDSGVTGSHFESTERSIYLCSDGSFQGSSSSQMAFDTAGGSGHSGGKPQTGSGRWEVATLGGGVSLVLRLTNGETISYRLETDGSKTFLEGQRWFVVENNVCP
jgi:hypothetical protein